MDHVAALAMHSSGCPLASRASLHSGRRTLLTGAQPASHWRSYRDFKQSIAARAVEDTTAPAAETPIPVPRPPKRPAGMSPVQQYKEYGWFASQLPEGEVGRFRFWHDEKRFKGTGEKSLVQPAPLAMGGIRTGGNIKSAPVQGFLGWQRMDDWDLLWSPSGSALKAAEHLRPGQLLCTVPGMFSITKKRRLPMTMQEAYGEHAFAYIPRTYSMPVQVRALQQHLQHSSSVAPTWILKTAQHLGKGLKIVPSDRVLRELARRQQQRQADKEVKPFVVAQEYIPDPLLINGKKFGIRLWALVTGHQPLKVYLHRNGLVLFSTEAYSEEGGFSAEDGSAAPGHVTNYAQNVDGDVWSLAQLKEHLGPEAFRMLFARMAKSTAMTFASALPDMQHDASVLGTPPDSCFEVVGLDFLVDSELRPWLLEVNATPSLAVEHADVVTEQMIHDQKDGMVQDMLQLLRVRERFQRPYHRLLKKPKPRAAAAAAVAAVGAAGEAAGDAAAQQGQDSTAAGDASPSSSTNSSSTSSSRTDSSSDASSSDGGEAQVSDEELSAIISSAFGQGTLSPQQLAALVQLERELQARGRFLPLMAIFPYDAAQHKWSVPWQDADLLARTWMGVRRQYLEHS